MPEAKTRALTFDEARRIVIQTTRGLTRSPQTETVPLDQVHSRILAEDLRADRDYPALRRSLRDGFAVKASDVPGTLRVRGEVRAGQGEQRALAPGEAIEVMTGAPVPDTADAVVMVEYVTRNNKGEVSTEQRAEPGQFINARGAEAQLGSVLIARGTRLDASHIAALAMCGHSQVSVYAPPSVAILATGDELVEVSEQPKPHQIRNSNAHMLATLVAASGGRPTVLPVARDTKEALRPLLEQGLWHDMLLISGGVSAGKYDLVKPGLKELGVEFHFERVR
ncbi:MAG: molybdopterin molybdotransferase MoeA, partial [Acidobacteriaceae bacterium]|nr:molybdopterin molybdotransferase MoeA [Acidobacteriaceae bacterium]